MRSRYLLSLSLTILSTPLFALVDYTETSAPILKEEAPKQKVVQEASSNKKPQLRGSRPIEFKASYATSEVKSSDGIDDKLNKLILDLRIETPWDIYLSANYWQGTVADNSFGNKEDKSGNPETILGFNWLRFGQVSNEARVDLYSGMSLKGKGDIAHSGNDTIVGIETSKRFLPFALSLGYELRLRGTPKVDEEISTGNISKIKAGLGWMASSNIHFGLEAISYTINPSKKDHVLKLDEKMTFSTISPMLKLGLSNYFSLEMGAVFRTKKPKENDLAMRLHNIPGLYGTTLFAGLGITL